ncbi:phospholipase A2, group VII [Moesziomyces antarcticus]|uniref:phospholipase A2, group VII n=1 Tax=Pseudozyma antarctica TaxID=84753 RepID=UPI000719745D|nr:phospholipase A2, group VII [Moesziomyces antarcticus]GAK62542.1 phospholipase A2, group VII [Moesziomyces antarcticus]
MGLPPYTGPFKVGVLDLEIPVRKPRSFCDNVVEPGELNKPARKARRRAKQQNQEAKQSRRDKQGRDEKLADSAEPKQKPGGTGKATTSSRSRPEAQTATSTESQSANASAAQASGHAQDEDSCQEKDESASKLPWSPWSSGSKTCTLHLETVLFTIYYPTLPMTASEEKRYPRAAWLGRPVHAGVRALLQYVGQYGLFAIPASPAVMTLINARLPARVGPPLADPEELHRQAHPDRQGTDRAKAGNFGKRPPQFPVVVFSHGLAGNRLSYSQFCGELASQGIIVAAIEHRDGSGVSSIVRGEEAPNQAGKSASLPKIIGHPSSGRMKASVPYFTFETIGLQSFATEPSEREVDLRRDQIEMRHAEIEETLYVLNEINEGRGYEIVQRSTRNLGTKLAGHSASATNARLPGNSILKAERPLEDWRGKLDLEFPTLCGHSFGGATVLELMRKPNPFPMAIVLDPWVEPVRDPAKEEDEVKGRIGKPVYVLNSESFTVWEEHFDKLKRICLDARKTSSRGWLLTLTGSKHTDFSDYPFLLPKMFRSTVGPRHTIEVFSKATYMQMGLSRQRARESHNKPGYKVDRQGSLRDDAPRSHRTRAVDVGGSAPSTEVTVSPTKYEAPASRVSDSMVGAAADHQNGLGQRGKGNALNSAQDTLTTANGQDRDVNVNVNADANAVHEAATSGFERSGLRQAESGNQTESGPCSCQELAEESKNDRAAGGQEARDIVGARHREVSSTQAATDTSTNGRARDFITDLRYLDMIDADQDVQQVHEALEDISQRLAHKHLSDLRDGNSMLTLVSPFLVHVFTGTTRPRSLMSIFMYYNGLRPGLERPGKVLIHQLDSSHPPK